MKYNLDSLLLVIVFVLFFGLLVGFFIRGLFIPSKKLGLWERMLNFDLSTINGESSKTWRSQDWIWAFTFLIYAQVFTVLYQDMVMVVVSFVSTFVSITLGAVAIYISLKQATSGDQLKDKINETLTAMSSKLNQMDNKFDTFNPNFYNKQAVEEQVNQAKEQVFSKVEGNDQETFSKDDVKNMISEQLDKLKTEIKDSLYNEESPREKNYNEGVLDEAKTIFVKIIQNIPSGTEFSMSYIINTLHDNLREFIHISHLTQWMGSMKRLGLVEFLDPYNYKKK
ncbi:hypothetical protein [Cohnella boryungensis]|uniref:Uncharacterized protein n=1 Tax=Cohnella boryungensis TaxID=768479 RepID=A0ABV8SH33_9BACL